MSFRPSLSRWLLAPLALALGVAASPARAAGVCDSNLLIVLDRSCSMDNPPGDTETRTKWVIAVEALSTLVDTYRGRLQFGLSMFPDKMNNACVQNGAVDVETGAAQETLIIDTLAATLPDGPCQTPIDTAVGQVSQDPAFAASGPGPGRRGFVLLVTDGKQSNECGGTPQDAVTEGLIGDLYAAGYPTYVVGFGGGVDPESLDRFAVAGGLPREGDPRYYQADSAVEFDEAVNAIVGAIVAGTPEGGGIRCAGTPCPDGRCFGEGERCVEQVCVGSAAGGDGGPAGGDGSAGQDGPGASGDAPAGMTADAPGGGGVDQGGAGDQSSGADGASGCSCQVAAGADLPRQAGATLLLIAVVACLAPRARRRRRPRPER